MIQGRTVLIVDELRDTREVLRAVLQSVGLRTYEAKRPAQGLELAQRHRPDVVVWDLEGGQDGSRDVSTPWPEPGAAEDWGEVPMVLLGRATLTDTRPPPLHGQPDFHYLPKPFQYVELIQTIEELLSDGAAGVEEPGMPQDTQR